MIYGYKLKCSVSAQKVERKTSHRMIQILMRNQKWVSSGRISESCTILPYFIVRASSALLRDYLP